MKTIGIMTRIDLHNDKKILYIPHDIYKKISNNFNVIIIPFDTNDTFEKIINNIKSCDGIILPGGDDIYELEIELVKYLYDNDIPTLGICLGMQTMAAALGAKFLPNSLNNHKSKETYVHKINIKENSLLFKIINNKDIMVNSRHKDSIVNPKLNIGALSDDNIIEEIEDTNKKFFVGVQWHPENLDDEYSKNIFKSFLDRI